MNREHFKAFVWLRWRLMRNQASRAGKVNAVILGLGAALLSVASAGAGLAGFLGGLFGLGDLTPLELTLVWDGAVGAFLFLWLISLAGQLQRSDAVSVERVLHLPVSPSGAFLVNYVSSLFNLMTALFLPGFLGLIFGLTLSRGALMLLALPLLAAFLFALTALTYQFQGWLASLMGNPRRRRTVTMLATCGIVLVSQGPQVLNMAYFRGRSDRAAAATEAAQKATAEADAARDRAMKQAHAEVEAANAALDPKAMTTEEFSEALARNGRAFKARLDQIGEEHRAELARVSERHRADLNGDGPKKPADAAKRARLEGTARLANTVLPPGWLPLGAGALAGGDPIPALLGTLGLTLIGSFCLWRAYRTTLRLVSGQASAGESRRAAAAVSGPRRLSMAEWRVPSVGEQTTAVAAAGLRSLIRAPEAKMVLLGPLIFAVVFGSFAATATVTIPELARPALAAAGVGMVLLVAVQLVGNQFGFDRGGFRAYVLAPVPRRDILLGKNLAAAPLLLGLGWLVVFVVGVVFPMRIDHWLAAFCQAAAMFLVFLAAANALSIAAPLPIAAGAMKASGVNFKQAFGQMLFVLLLPLAVAPTFVPLGVEALLTEAAGVARGWPVALALSLVLLAGVALLYRVAIGWEGRWLAAREREVLGVVTAKEE